MNLKSVQMLYSASSLKVPVIGGSLSEPHTNE